MNMYLSDVIPTEIYGTWFIGEKVVIAAPTGAGKTMFVLLKIVPYAKSLGKKVLILCNRRLLREQYLYDLLTQYARYCELEKDVAVWTYQQIAEELKKGQDLHRLLQEFEVIIMDEVHYFYNDSDFNCFGTYVLLQALILACFRKTIIMITATLTETLPLLEKTFLKCSDKLRREGIIDSQFEKFEYHGKIYDYTSWADYNRFTCIYLADKESLCEEISNAEGKTVMFIDDIRKAESFRKDLIATKKIAAEEIIILNAQVIDEGLDSEVVRSLTLKHKVPCRVLITTSVLDNGVSIHDSEVKNVIIATESRVSFLQMVGRIRAESVGQCNLYIYPREVQYFEKRVAQYEERIKLFDTTAKTLAKTDAFGLLLEGWYGRDDKSEQLRKIMALTTWQNEYYSDSAKDVVLRRGNTALAINEFAKEKNGNLLLAERNFLRLAVNDPRMVAEKQISWIGKKADELLLKKSTFREERERQLCEQLLKIVACTNKELIEKKKELAKEFRRDLLGEDISKDGSFSTEKLIRVCTRCGLVFEKFKGEDKNERYTVKRGGENNADEHERVAE